MADPILVMLSSRVDDPQSALPDGTTLRDVRDAVRKDLQGIELGGDPLFEVFVNEGAPAQSADADVERHCREQVDRADVVLVLYNGRAGWTSQKLAGICEIELRAALERGPQKVRVVQLPLHKPKPKAKSPDAEFRAYVESLSLWTSAEAATTGEIISACREAVHDAVATMVHERARLGSLRSPEGRGEALRWRRLSLGRRAAAMRAAVAEALVSARGATALDAGGSARLVNVPGTNTTLLMRVDAVPAAMSVAAAREIVGQPFLRDHELASQLDDETSGPVHLVAVHGGVTEAQAVRQLGSPDATFVPTDFGVYVADEIQKVQIVFLSRCIDGGATRARVQMLLDWLVASEEGERLERRAQGRTEVVGLLARLSAE